MTVRKVVIEGVGVGKYGYRCEDQTNDDAQGDTILFI